MSKDYSQTMLFDPIQEEKDPLDEILRVVYQALKEKGYSPESQIIGYILSGDPTYITSHNDARKKIRQIDRDELLEELLNTFLEKYDIVEKEV